jgi:RNA polymerase sigma-70 factor (sigma-E family)
MGSHEERDADFASFVRLHAEDLRRAAWMLTGQRDAASDLVQETLTRLYPKWQRVAAADSQLAYVRKAVLRQFLSDRRRRRPEVLSGAPPIDTAAQADAYENLSDRLTLAEPLRAIAPKQRAAVLLKYYHQLSDREAARAMGCTAPTFRSHARRGLAALRSALDAPRPAAHQRSTGLGP